MATHRIEEELECPICRDRYDTPKQLPCQHTYCLRCLQQLDESWGVVQCPECRAIHPVPARGVSDFPTSVVLQRLLDNYNQRSTPIWTTSGVTGTQNDMSMTGIPLYAMDDHSVDSYGIGRDMFDDSLEPQFSHPRQIDYNEQQIDEETELELAIQISEEEERARRRRNQQKCSGLVVLEKVGKYIRCVGGRFMDNYKNLLSALIILFMVLTITRLVVGALKLSSECEEERQAAMYLFVKGCVAILFWGSVCNWHFRRVLRNALRNRFVEVYLTVDALFSIFWLLLGTVWIFGNFSTLNSQCSTDTESWTGYFFYFAFILTVLDYIGLLLFLFYSGYTLCDNNNENE